MVAANTPLFVLPAVALTFAFFLLGGTYRAWLSSRAMGSLKPRWANDAEERLLTEEHVNFGPPRLK